MFEVQGDTPEADVVEAPAVEVAPPSPARQRLAGLLSQRDEAESEAQGAREAIARLQSAIASPGPIESQIGALDSAEAGLIARWSTEGGPFPTLDAGRRQALEEVLSEARNKAAGAARAIPTLESSFYRASNKAAALSAAINASIAEIVLEEVQPSFDEIVTAKASLAAMIARVEAGRELALQSVEAIPQDRRLAVASGFYQSLSAVDKLREAAMSNPPMSHDRGPWAEFARALTVDAGATVTEG